MTREATLQSPNLDELWSRHHAQWRDTAQVTSHWDQANQVSEDLLEYKEKGNFFGLLEDLKITLLVTREYEHLLLALSTKNSQPHLSYFNMPHPSGLAVDREKGLVHVASTRNPNQIFTLKPVSSTMNRLDAESSDTTSAPLVPVKSIFLPGCMYMHDLAVINSELYANAVGHNAIVKISDDGEYKRVWWPKCIEVDGKPVFGQNHIQLNSIAQSNTIENSYFSASSLDIEDLRPGDPDYPVDKRGVIFDGKTREPIAQGLTRPHSARIFQDKVWVNNSGYGELGYCKDGKFNPITKFDGWTRGLFSTENVAFVGTSRVIPRFSQYAPGLDVNKSVCGIHAIDLRSGDFIGSITWHSGNQIFAIEAVSQTFSLGFPFTRNRNQESEKLLFYTYETNPNK